QRAVAERGEYDDAVAARDVRDDVGIDDDGLGRVRQAVHHRLHVDAGGGEAVLARQPQLVDLVDGVVVDVERLAETGAGHQIAVSLGEDGDAIYPGAGDLVAVDLAGL